ncbi:MAG: transpeptidase family protein [Fusobacteriaceae bacterium]|nr:transpeptidase family protein [Fusobacteriaceae bacterium]
MFKYIKIGILLINIILVGVNILSGNLYSSIYSILFFLYFLFAFYKSKATKTYGYFGQRAIISGRIILFCFLLATCRLIQIQIKNGAEYSRRIKRQSEAFVRRFGTRGEIFDSNGKSLAYNSTTYEVAMDPSLAYSNEKILMAANEIFDLPFIKENREDFFKSLEEFFNNKRKYKLIEKGLSEDKKDQIDAIISKYKLTKKEIFIQENGERLYYKNDLYNSIVGFVGYTDEYNDEKIGTFGLEKEYDVYLKGKKSKREMRVDRGRHKIPISEPEMQKQIDGKNIYLTIDSDIQMVLNEEVKKQFTATKSEGAYGVVMDPNNGRVLATATFYDKQRPLRNGIFQDQMEPGSIFKSVIMAAALNEKFVKKEDKFNIGNGTLVRHEHTIKETTNSLKGTITAEDILIKSSNTGMVLIGEKFTNKLFEEYLKNYGFYDGTGIDFPNEIKPRATPSQKWDGLKKNTMSFGQGIAVSPIQMITAFSAVINGGTLYKPYIVDRIEDEEGVVVRRNIPTAVKRVLTTDTSDLMREILEDVINKGTGTRAQVNGFRIGGKTGTGQIVSSRGGYLKDDYLASFIGFFPADKPKYVILLMFLKPNSGAKINEKYGGTVAAPTFADIVKRITKIKSIWSEESVYVQEIKNIDTIVIPPIGGNNTNFKKLEGKMPNLLGLSSKEVINLFFETGIELEIEGKGLVESQFPDEGTDLEGIKNVIIKLN